MTQDKIANKMLNVPRSTSMSSSTTSSNVSPMTLEMSPSSLSTTSTSQVSIRDLTECLHRIHALEGQQRPASFEPARIHRTTPSNKAVGLGASGRKCPTLKLALKVSTTATSKQLIKSSADSRLAPEKARNPTEPHAEELSGLLMQALGLVSLLRENVMNELPASVQRRAGNILAENEAVQASPDVVYLFGRCFNLSMNAKILSQCNYADPGIAARVLTDLSILELSLKSKSRPLQDTLLLADSLDKVHIL